MEHVCNNKRPREYYYYFFLVNDTYNAYEELSSKRQKPHFLSTLSYWYQCVVLPHSCHGIKLLKKKTKKQNKNKNKNKKKKKKPHTFFSLIGFSYTLLCEFCQKLLIFVPKGINSTKIEQFCSKR